MNFYWIPIFQVAVVNTSQKKLPTSPMKNVHVAVMKNLPLCLIKLTSVCCSLSRRDADTKIEVALGLVKVLILSTIWKRSANLLMLPLAVWTSVSGIIKFMRLNWMGNKMHETICSVALYISRQWFRSILMDILLTCDLITCMPLIASKSLCHHSACLCNCIWNIFMSILFTSTMQKWLVLSCVWSTVECIVQF